MEEKKNKNKIAWLIAILVIIVLIGIIIFLLTTKPKEEILEPHNETKTINDISIDELLTEIENVINTQEEVNGKDIIRIKSVKTSTPNSVGGVDLEIEWTNLSDKTIKYITFIAYPVNAVNDIVECTIRPQYKGRFNGMETGPIETGQGNKKDYVYANAWYNNTIVKAILMQVDIEYMDGSKVSLTGDNLEQAIY